MEILSVSAPRVHLHWVRETPPRGLQLPVSSTLTDLDSLPSCARAAIRASGREDIELHLPFYQADRYISLENWSEGLEFRERTAGVLTATHRDEADHAAAEARHQAMTLVYRAIFADTTPLTLVAEPARSPLLRQLLPRQHVCAPNGGLAGAPPERSGRYVRVYRAISVALQTALREYLPSAHIDLEVVLDHRTHALSLLAWSAAEPVFGPHVDALGVDVLDSGHLQRACNGLPFRLARRLEEIWTILDRVGVDRVLRRPYDPCNAVKVLQHCRRFTRFFFLLFSNERRLIEAFVGFCIRIAGWRERARTQPAKVFREVRAEWLAVESICNRFYQSRPHSPLGSLLLVEAVRALEAID